MELISATAEGKPASGTKRSPSVSADGRYIAFCSTAKDLVEGDTNDKSDVFVCDRRAAKIRRINLGADGSQADGNSNRVAISANGNAVAFESSATNLAGPAEHVQIYLCDLTSGAIKRVSISNNGDPADDDCEQPVLSADGRFVAFASKAKNLVSTADTNGRKDVFVRDQLAAKTSLVSVNLQGKAAIYGAEKPSLSADGRWIAFESISEDLVVDDHNWAPDIFVLDQTTGVVSRVSITSTGGEPAFPAVNPSISGDGRFVAFSSLDPTFAADDNNSTWDVFWHDRETKTTKLISRSSTGQVGNSASGDPTLGPPSISHDGRLVAFSSGASNLEPGVGDSELPSRQHVHVRETVADETIVVSTLDDWKTDSGGGLMPALAQDGQAIAFLRGTDVYVFDLGATGPVFPQYANGETGGIPNRTRIILTNGSKYPEEGQISFCDSQGNPAIVPVGGKLVSGVPYSIPAWGSFEVATDGTGPLQSGAVRVTSTRGPFSRLHASEAFQLLHHDISLEGSADARAQLVYVSRNQTENTAVAAYNPTVTSVRIQADLRDRMANIRASKQLQMSGHSQISLFVDDPNLFGDYFAANPGDFNGTLSLQVLDGKTIFSTGLIQKRESGALIAISTTSKARDDWRGIMPWMRKPLIFPQFVNGEVDGIRNRTRIIVEHAIDGENSHYGFPIQFQDPAGAAALVPIKGKNRSGVWCENKDFGVLDFETDGTGILQFGTVVAGNVYEGAEVFDILSHYVSVPNCLPRKTHQIYASVTSRENTGVAMYRPKYQIPTTADIWLLDETGQECASRQVTIRPGEQVALFLDDARLFKDFFLSHPADFHGTLNITVPDSSIYSDVSVLGLIQKRQSGALVAIGSGTTAYSH